MRIAVPNQNLISASLRTRLQKAGYAAIERAAEADYVAYLEPEMGPYVVVDGVDSSWERHIINMIAELTPTPILLQRQGGIQSDRSILIKVPFHAERAVELGLFRGIIAEMSPVNDPELAERIAKIEAALAPKKYWRRVWEWLQKPLF